MDGIRLERLAIEVPELEGSVDRFKAVLGPGFGRRSVRQATGTVHVAIHPAGTSCWPSPGASRGSAASTCVAPTWRRKCSRPRFAGWREIDSFEVDGRPHVVFDVSGLRVVVLGAD